jgi:hypothetical protein
MEKTWHVSFEPSLESRVYFLAQDCVFSSQYTGHNSSLTRRQLRRRLLLSENLEPCELMYGKRSG